MRASKVAAWVMSATMAALVVGVPFVYYRYCYTYAKRLRPVDEGILYRSGCMTADGLADAIEKLHIRTVINLMEEMPDPILTTGYFDTTEIREAAVCEQHGAKMIALTVDLIPPSRLVKERPEAIDAFLDLMDDSRNHPVLIHCKAGLHRTGVMVAVYRMEYDGWTPSEAIQELKSHGFGDFAATSSNAYVLEYILAFERGRRGGRTGQAMLGALPGLEQAHPIRCLR